MCRNECAPLLNLQVSKTIGFAAARAHRHLPPPERNAVVHGVCAGPDGRARGRPGALRIRRLLVPDPGERGGGPDQPAEQRLGVGAPLPSISRGFLPSVNWCPSWGPCHPLKVMGVSELSPCARFHCVSQDLEVLQPWCFLSCKSCC